MNIKDYVLVLGSGESILDLTESEKKILNSIEVKIGINKYGAFYQKAGIKPTHVFFLDYFSQSSRFFLKKNIKNLKSKDHITYLISEYYVNKVFRSYIHYLFKMLLYKIMEIVKAPTIYVLRKLIKPISKNKFNYIKDVIFKIPELDSILFIPNKHKIVYLNIQNWKKKGNKWSTSTSNPLYHFRGSLSSVFNYITIKHSNKKVILVGVDFINSNYFFQKEYLKYQKYNKDWTSELTKKFDQHFSFINYEGTTMELELPYMLENLSKSKCELFVLSENTYFYKKGFAKLFKI